MQFPSEELESLIHAEDQRHPLQSLPLDRHLWLESSAIDDLVDQIAKEIDTLPSSQVERKRQKKSEEKLRFAIKLILLNLLLIHKWPSRKARQHLEMINTTLNRHWYDLDMTNEQFMAFEKAIAEQHRRKAKLSPVVNYSDKRLYRVFNNGSKKNHKQNFKEGGRFYGGWWQSIPSDYRKYITIDNKHTIEVDYANLHPQMLYTLAGERLESDAYSDIHGVPRELAKELFMRLLNGDSSKRPPKDFRKNWPDIKWSAAIRAMEEKHAPIRQYFNTGFGLQLQRIDADMLEGVLLHYARLDTPCLPIHDSVIMHYAYKDELKEVMLEEYRKAMQSEISFKIDDYQAEWLKEYVTQRRAANYSIEEILKDLESSVYEKRWNEWCDHKHGQHS